MKRPLALVLGVVVLAGCGSSGSGDSVLRNDVAGAVAAARAGDGVLLQGALAQLRKDVAAGQASGAIDADRARRVLAAAAALASDVPGATVVKPSPTPSPTPHVVTTKKRGKGKQDEGHSD